MNVIAYTFEAVRTVFVEFVLYAETFDGESFTPSERTRRQHEQNLHRRKLCWRRLWTMGDRRRNRWAKVTLMTKDRVVGHGTTTSISGSPDRSKVAKWGDEKVKQQGKGQGGFKDKGKAFLGEEEAQDPDWQSEEDGAWWSKGRRGKKGSSKGKIASLKVVVGLPTQKRVHAVISTRTKAEARNEEERRKKVLILNWISQPQNHPVKRRIVISGESYDWYDCSSVSSAVHSTAAW